MKKFTFILLIAFFAGWTSAWAQEDDFQVLFGKGTKIRGFAGPLFVFSSVSGDFAPMIGGGGGVMLDKLFIGGYGIGLTNSINLDSNLDFGYGGIWFGYTFVPNKRIHPSISALLGLGNVTSTEDLFEEDNVYVINPGVEAEVNVTRFFKISFGASYRIVGGISDNGAKLEGFRNHDFSGPTGLISFRFGWFE